MKIKDIINYIVETSGYTIIKNRLERRAIIEAKKHFKGKEIVACEIGCFEGEHSLQMLKNLNIKKLYIIDPYEIYEDYKKDGSCSVVNKAKIKAHKLLKKYEDKIVWIEKYSDDAINDVDMPLDLLYIDGNHYHPYIDNDIKNYFPKVKNGGIISGHDYCLAWSDVMEAVFNLSKKMNMPVLTGYSSDWIFFKSKIPFKPKNKSNAR
jgi:hypothetical protein